MTAVSGAGQQRPMSRYRLLARLRVAHAYFNDGQARDLLFEPDLATHALIERFGLIARSNGQELALHAPESSLAALWSERESRHRHRPQPQQQQHPAGTLCWRLRSRDPDFWLYTAARAPCQFVLPLVAAGVADFKVWQQGLGASQWLRLGTRLSTWKYLLRGDWRDHRLSLVDARGEVEFHRDEAELLPDGRSAEVFRSTRRLPLTEQVAHRFELRDVGVDPPRLLIARLPGAAPRGLQCESRQGRRRPVNEIFLNR